METDEALIRIAEFKGNSLKEKFRRVKLELLGKGKSDITAHPLLFEAALEVKRISAQIDEIVHAAGIIKCLPLILEPGEVIENLSLAAGAEGEGFDLITDRRVAEFKFARWQGERPNGMRKRQVFSDFVNLMLCQTTKKKVLYVYEADKIRTFFSSKKARWRRTLSRRPELCSALEDYMLANSKTGQAMLDVYSQIEIEIIDIDDLLGDERS